MLRSCGEFWGITHRLPMTRSAGPSVLSPGTLGAWQKRASELGPVDCGMSCSYPEKIPAQAKLGRSTLRIRSDPKIRPGDPAPHGHWGCLQKKAPPFGGACRTAVSDPQ